MKKNKEKKKKVTLSDDSPLSQEVVSEMEDLLTIVKATELRKAIIALYFDVTTCQTDYSLDFPLHSHWIFELLTFLDVACEYENRREANKKEKKK